MPMSDAPTGEAIDVGPGEASEMLASGEATLVDVRQPEEWEAGRIPGSIHIEINELTGRAGEISAGDKPIVFVCKSGSRSSFAVQAFREAGFDARNLDGGVTAWAEQGLPLEPEDGKIVSPLPAPR